MSLGRSSRLQATPSADVQIPGLAQPVSPTRRRPPGPAEMLATFTPASDFGVGARFQICPSAEVQMAVGSGSQTAPAPSGGTQWRAPDDPIATRFDPTGNTRRIDESPAAGTSSKVRVQLCQSAENQAAAWPWPAVFWNSPTAT